MKPTFEGMFRQATGNPVPLPYQKRLALGDHFPALLDVPTGLGKTAAAILAWVWQRRFAEEAIRTTTPRRLVYCLPMRVLVEQTLTESVKWLDRLGLLAGSAEWTETDADRLPTNSAQLKRATDGVGRGYRAEPNAERSNGWASTNGDHGQHPIAVHLLLGGEEKTDWALWPERDAILIGTQDMLLSRAMNRGYAAGRARWPLEFGFLNSDCLWVFDEIQIMDTGLASSLQFDAWRRNLRLRPARDQFPEEKKNHLSRRCHSLWMSATMAKHWLERAVDWSPRVEEAWGSRHQLEPEDDGNDRVKGLFDNKKELVKTPVSTLTVPKGKDSKPDVPGYLDKLVPQILKHKAGNGLTLVIVNTVDRAVGIFRRLKSKSNDIEFFLIHSRFRPMERERWAEFLGRKDGKPRIVVSTQVIEAGVDLSANVLFTELAPWASLVQRFGRCARFIFLGDDGKVLSEHGTVYWMDIAANEGAALPYSVEELTASRSILERPDLGDVGLQALKDLRPQLDAQATTLFPYEPRFVPHDKDLFDLFDTTPDLTGADVDISRFIRDGEELDVQVFWRPDGITPSKKDRPHRRELCAVPFHRFRDFAREAIKLRHRIWRRQYSKGPKRTAALEPLDFGSVDQVVYPGQVFLLEKSCGGYDRNLGWTGDPSHQIEPMSPVEPAKAALADDEDDDDSLSISRWLAVSEHTLHVCLKLDELLTTSGLSDSEIKVLRLAARLHDWGKAHEAFQAKLMAASVAEEDVQQKLNKQPAAKAPDSSWRKNKIRPQPADTLEADKDKRRPGFRHELASALAILEALYRAKPDHCLFAWPAGLDRAGFGEVPNDAPVPGLADDPLICTEADLEHDWGYASSLELEPLFGIKEGRSHDFFPASAYRGPFLQLLRHHAGKGLAFIISVFNHSAEWYAHPRAPSEYVEPPSELTLTFSDGSSRKQWCNDRLWNLYRGTSVGPYVLQSALMALEQWLLEIADAYPKTLDSVLLRILHSSESAALTAVVASVATAFPHAAGEALLALLSSPVCILLDRHRLVSESQAPTAVLGMFPQTDAAKRIYNEERKQADARPHRRHDLETAIANLQLGPLAARVHELLDRHRSQLPPVDEQDEGDQVWRLALQRMDLRQYTVAEETAEVASANEAGNPPEDGRHRVLLNLNAPESDLQEMVEQGASEFNAMNTRLGILMWGMKVFGREEATNYDSAHWRQRLQEARSLAPASGDNSEPGKGGPGFVAAVSVRDHWQEMSTEEQDWCVGVICAEVERDADNWNQFARVQRFPMGGDRPCAWVLPALLGQSLTDATRQRVLNALVFALTHAVREVRAYAASGVGNQLWTIDRELALRCVNALAMEASLVQQGAEAEHRRPYDQRRSFDEFAAEAAATVRRRFFEPGAIPDDIYQTFDSTEWFGADANGRILAILGHAPTEPAALAAFRRVGSTLVGWWDADDDRKHDRQQRTERHHETESALTDVLESFLLRTSAEDAATVVQPIIDAIDRHPREIHWLLRGLVEIEDRRPNTPQFWAIWRLFAEKVRGAKWLPRIDEEHSRGSEMMSAIFLGSGWKDHVRHWRSLEGYADHVHLLFEALPASSTVLDDYIRFLYHVGEQSLPRAFVRVAQRLQHGDPAHLLRKGNTVFMLEVLLQRYVYGRPLELKQQAELRNAILVLLDMLVEYGSSAAYRMRDDFVTPIPAQ